MSRISTTLLLLGLGLVLVGIANADINTWENRLNGARRTRLCHGVNGADSWVRRNGYTRCQTCQSRCYRADLKGTAETNGNPVGLCDAIGETCDITVFVMTSPCCACSGGFVANDLYEEDDMDIFELSASESSCEVPFLGVLVNGSWTLPLENNCDISQNAVFEQSWVKGDYTINTLRDCPNQGQAGARLTQAFDTNYRNARYPDPCFRDDHFVSSYMTENNGLISSSLKMWRPNNNNVWFDIELTRNTPLVQINCKSIPAKEDIPVWLVV